MPDNFDWVTGNVAHVCALLARTQKQAAARGTVKQANPASPPESKPDTGKTASAAGPSYLTNSLIVAGLGGLLGTGRSLWNGNRRGSRLLQDALTGALLGGATGAGGTAAYDLLTRPTPQPDRKPPTEKQVALEKQRNKLLMSRQSHGLSVRPDSELVQYVDAQVARGEDLDPQKVLDLSQKLDATAPPQDVSVWRQGLNRVGDAVSGVKSVASDDPANLTSQHLTNAVRPTGIQHLWTHSTAGNLGNLAASAYLGGLASNRVGDYQRNNLLREVLAGEGTKAMLASDPNSPAGRAVQHLKDRNSSYSTSHLRKLLPVSSGTIYTPGTQRIPEGGALTRRDVDTILAQAGKAPTSGQNWARRGAGLAGMLAPLLFQQHAAKVEPDYAAMLGLPGTPGQSAMQDAGLALPSSAPPGK